MLNAGADWVDSPFVDNSGIISSRTPDDLPAFVSGLLAAIGNRVEA